MSVDEALLLLCGALAILGLELPTCYIEDGHQDHRHTHRVYHERLEGTRDQMHVRQERDDPCVRA